MSEDQEDAIRNAWLDLSAMVEHISRIGNALTKVAPVDSKACEELVKAGSDSIKELEENFEFLKQR
jgi:hypothetical protein